MELGLKPVEIEELGADELPPLYSAWARRQQREDYRAGVVASLLANKDRDSKRAPVPYTPASFFPSLEDMFPGPQPVDDDELERKLVAAFG